MVEHWGEALNMGAVAGRTIAGEDAVWDVAPGFWSTIGDHTLKYVAWGDGFDEARLTDHGGGAWTVRYEREGELVGVLTHERDEDYEAGPRSSRAAGMKACVVVPARDEEELIGACIAALAAQTGVARADYEVLLVLDRCTDATEARARAAAGDMTLHVHRGRPPGRRPRAPPGHGPGRGAPAARRPDRHHRRRLRARAGLAARAAGRGREREPARSAGGSSSARTTSPPPCSSGAAADAARRHAALTGTGAREHHQFSGASLAVTAATYAEVGRLEPREALEDEGFERALRRHGVPIERLSAVRVTTSGRRFGRARRGLAVDLRRNAWLAERSYDNTFTLEQLLAAKDRTISVILPAREVAGTLGAILDALPHELLDEVLVVDADSRDGTAESRDERGVRVENESSLQPGYGPALGKGDAMWRGLAATTRRARRLPRHGHRGLRPRLRARPARAAADRRRRLRQGPLPAPVQARRHASTRTAAAASRSCSRAPT